MGMDRIAFSFKNTPNLTIKGKKIDLARASDTMKLPNGKTIKGFRADDGTFFQLKKKGTGENATTQVIVRGEAAKLRNWNFKVRNGALSKMSLANGKRYGTDSPVYSSKTQTFIFDSTTSWRNNYGLKKLAPKTTELSVDTVTDSERPPVDPKRRKLIENAGAGKLDALSSDTFKAADLKFITHLLSDREVDVLNAYAEDSGDTGKKNAAKKLFESLDTAFQMLNRRGWDAVNASCENPANPELRDKALLVLNKAREEGDRARTPRSDPRRDLPVLPLGTVDQRRLLSAIGEGKFDDFIDKDRLKLVFPLLDPAEQQTLLQYLDNPSKKPEQDRARDLLRGVNGAFLHLSEDGVDALVDLGSPDRDPAHRRGKEGLAKLFLNSARQAFAHDERMERALFENENVLEKQGLRRVEVSSDGNCFFHACARNIASRESDENVMDYRNGIANFVRSEGPEELLRQMAEKDRDNPFPEPMVTMDATFLRNLGANAKGVRSESNRPMWGNLQHARLLAAMTGKPVVVIAPKEAGGPIVLNPDFSHRPLQGTKDPVLSETNRLARPIVLVFDGLNHWDAAVPK